MSYAVNFFKIIALFEVSGKPPLLLIITAEPLLAASRLVLPNGSSHLDETTEILTYFNFSNIFLCSTYPFTERFSCLKSIFSLGSSPMTIAFQSLYLSNILRIASPKRSYPFAEFNFPTKDINFFFFCKIYLN